MDLWLLILYTRKWNQGSWIRVFKWNFWILNSLVSGTFADPLQDPDLHHHLAQSVLAKAQKNAVLAGAGVLARAGVVAGARVDLGERIVDEKK
ncbi:hypothetical protein QVD17_17001 [Tagetes erecta]|uniref:Uncharacterized protein n=1 Tax=Tagetes erecta TaxID=13708 RepID=A0AAD8KXK6_TARER|nr:hypothetical protein QVD17_17001 [Tagetes erecta]